MSGGSIILFLIVAYLVVRMFLRNKRKNDRIQKYGEEFGSQINQQKISIGMTPEMIADALGSPAKSDGKTIRENYVKEILYYGAFKDAKQKTQYKYRIIFENDKVAEIHEN